jgi:hypothetical protein
MSVRLNLEAFGTYKTTTNERKGTLYSTTTNIENTTIVEKTTNPVPNKAL